MSVQSVSVIALLGVLAILMGADLCLTIRRDRDRIQAKMDRARAQQVDERVSAAARRESAPAKANRQLTPPPMIDGQTLKSWLIYRAQDEGVWNYVVTEMYERAAASPRIKSYFENTIEGGRFSDLQTHFLGALMIVTNSGVTQGIVDAMREGHRGVRNSDNQAITPEIYGLVIGTLVDILREVGVPEHGIAALGETIAPLQAAIVRP
jgi:hypothetical protein